MVQYFSRIIFTVGRYESSHFASAWSMVGRGHEGRGRVMPILNLN